MVANDTSQLVPFQVTSVCWLSSNNVIVVLLQWGYEGKKTTVGQDALS
ncbi:hypothetical protein KR51_00028220 [Rubidibacter lacunae KORDI 51-2]|uniref:Uncharacterized protein n=1 Tax=Rubidibacter lacunae KORDI 51-2 TaxID=582515 RepID=U5DJS1_9CHRO|nr:hypothetical protein KR51_00028220 [Rubidibacter lacunae KORDI 51-2]